MVQMGLLVWEPRYLLDNGSHDGWIQVPFSSQEDEAHSLVMGTDLPLINARGPLEGGICFSARLRPLVSTASVQFSLCGQGRSHSGDEVTQLDWRSQPCRDSARVCS